MIMFRYSGTLISIHRDGVNYVASFYDDYYGSVSATGRRIRSVVTSVTGLVRMCEQERSFIYEESDSIDNGRTFSFV